MAAGIEDRIEVFLPDAVEAHGFVELSFRCGIAFKPECEVGPELRFVALGVERRATALWVASVISTPASLKT